MEVFVFDVTQPADTFYTGQIVIKAKDKKEAIAILKSKTNEELDELVQGWEISDQANPSGNIEVWDNNKVINV